MAAPYNPPVKNEEFKVRIALAAFAVPGTFKASPSIAVGDFKVDLDGAGLNNLTNLPTVSPAASVLVLLDIPAAQMNADVVTIIGIDQTSPKEWCDFVLSIPTTSA
jgi:hypothetical protein